MEPCYRLRLVEPGDEAFLRRLFNESRPELALLPLPPEQKDKLIDIQYRGQEYSYAVEFPGHEHSIVLVDGAPVGQLRVWRGPSEYRLVDISLDPGRRSAGLGTALVSDLIEQASAAGQPLRCSIARNNSGSLRFHQRLGFRVVSEDLMYFQLECPTKQNAYPEG